jgi:predicted HNH restriction endonuclease
MEYTILKELIDNNLSTRKIATHLNCSQGNVKYWLKKYNIKTNVFNIPCEDVAEKKKRNVMRVQRKRIELKLKAIEYKGGKCSICGYSKCKDALDFHHIDEKDKEFGIGEKGYTRSWEKVKIELDKCILVCANCHREIHSNKED